MKAFWIIYEVLLLGCEALFILRMISVFKALTKIKRRYAFAPTEILAGHKVQPTRSELLPALRRCRTELAAWCSIAAVTAYGCVDCLIFWVMR